MDRGFRLSNGQTASYEWGSHAIRLAHATNPPNDLLHRLFAAMVNGSASWTDDADFRHAVSILHEAAHSAQDLCTGAGLWDFFLRESLMPDMLRELRMASWSSPFGKQPPRKLAQAYRQWLAGGFLPRSRPTRAKRMRHVSERLKIDPNITRRSLRLTAFAFDRLLEADAVVQVGLMLQGLQMSATQRQVMNRNGALWLAPDMARAYQGVYYDVISLLKQWAKADRRKPDAALLAVAMFLTAFLIDLSLAHPTPRYLDSQSQDPGDHEPGLKFALLLSALSRLTTDESNEFLHALVKGEVDQAERMLLPKCAIAYPPTRQVYVDWADELNAKLRKLDDPITQLRTKAISARLARPADFVRKSLFTFLREQGLPIIVLQESGYRLTSMDPFYIDSNNAFALASCLQHEMSARRLLHAAYEGYPFECGRAEFGTCKAAQPQCRSGIAHAQDFPASPDCSMRAWLEGSSFGYFHPVHTK